MLKRTKYKKKGKMRQWVLKDGIINTIKSDPELYGKVAKALKVSTLTMPRLLASKSTKLTQFSALEVLGKYLKKGQRELIEVVESEMQPAA